MGKAIDQFCELTLAGVLTQLAIEKGVKAGLVPEGDFSNFVENPTKMCEHYGAGYWSELFLLPFAFAIIGGVRASSKKLQRFFLIFGVLFVFIMTISDFGHLAMKCSGFDDTKHVFEYVSVGIPALAAVVMTALAIFR